MAPDVRTAAACSSLPSPPVQPEKEQLLELERMPVRGSFLSGRHLMPTTEGHMRNGCEAHPTATGTNAAIDVADFLTKADIERRFGINRHVILRHERSKDPRKRLIPVDEPRQNTFPWSGPRFRYDDIVELKAAIDHSKLESKDRGRGTRYFSVQAAAKTFGLRRQQLLGAIRHRGNQLKPIKKLRPGSALVERYELPDKELRQYLAEPARRAWRFNGVYDNGCMNLSAAAKTEEAQQAGVSYYILCHAVRSGALKTEEKMRCRLDTYREEHVITPESLATFVASFLRQPRRWAKRFNGIYGGTEPNRRMNAREAARLKGVKIHIIRQAPKDKLPWTWKRRPGTKECWERVYRESDVDKFLNPTKWTPQPGRISFEDIAAERKAVSSRARDALYLALKKIRELYPDCSELSPGRGRARWYDPVVIRYLDGVPTTGESEPPALPKVSDGSHTIQMAHEAALCHADGETDRAQSGQSEAGTQNDSRAEPTPKKKKRSTERGEGQAKLSAALVSHHRYKNGSCLNWEPVGNNELADNANVAWSTAKRFFDQKFHGYKRYKAACLNQTDLIASLRILNGEIAPHMLLYGRRPPGDGHPEH